MTLNNNYLMARFYVMKLVTRLLCILPLLSPACNLPPHLDLMNKITATVSLGSDRVCLCVCAIRSHGKRVFASIRLLSNWLSSRPADPPCKCFVGWIKNKIIDFLSLAFLFAGLLPLSNSTRRLIDHFQSTKEARLQSNAIQLCRNSSNQKKKVVPTIHRGAATAEN